MGDELELALRRQVQLRAGGRDHVGSTRHYGDTITYYGDTLLNPQMARRPRRAIRSVPDLRGHPIACPRNSVETLRLSQPAACLLDRLRQRALAGGPACGRRFIGFPEFGVHCGSRKELEHIIRHPGPRAG